MSVGCHTPSISCLEKSMPSGLLSYEAIAAGKATARAFTLFFPIHASRMILLAHHRAFSFLLHQSLLRCSLRF